jgi:hypothetical protein
MIRYFTAAMTCLCLTASAGEAPLTGNLSWDLSAMPTDTGIVTLVTGPVHHQNPFSNGLYSLLLPGAGQYHAERYTKAGIFLAVEAALITFAVINQGKGNSKTEDFQRYADAHWSALRYAQWISTYGVSDYGPNITFTPADLAAIGNRDFSRINEWERGTHSTGFTHQLPKWGEQQYYELIGKYNQYKFGWDTYPTDVNGVPVSDSRQYDSMIPQQMLDYSKERGKANDYFYAAGFAAGVLVINHVVSALDAFLSTRSFNNVVTSSMGMKVDEIGGQRTLTSVMTVSVSF